MLASYKEKTLPVTDNLLCQIITWVENDFISSPFDAFSTCLRSSPKAAMCGHFVMITRVR